MRIDRYVHDERLTWSAAGVLMLVAALHLSGIARLLFAPPSEAVAEAPPPIFQVSLQKLPPPRLPPDLQPRPADAPPPPTGAVQQRPRQTRPVPILVDTPTTDPVPPDTQVKKYEMGDELLPGVPGPPMPEGAGDDELYADAAPVEETPVLWNLKLVDMRPPIYPPRCLRLGIEGRVKVRVLVGENGRPQEVTVGESSGESALDQAAIEAVREWRFEPAKRNGVAVRAWAIVPVEFKLID
jgi:periplasmic protein TonB